MKPSANPLLASLLLIALLVPLTARPTAARQGPTNLYLGGVELVAGTIVDLKWDTAGYPDGTYFWQLWRTGPGGAQVILQGEGPGQDYHRDTGLAPGGEYLYELRISATSGQYLGFRSGARGGTLCGTVVEAITLPGGTFETCGNVEVPYGKKLTINGVTTLTGGYMVRALDGGRIEVQGAGFDGVTVQFGRIYPTTDRAQGFVKGSVFNSASIYVVGESGAGGAPDIEVVGNTFTGLHDRVEIQDKAEALVQRNEGEFGLYVLDEAYANVVDNKYTGSVRIWDEARADIRNNRIHGDGWVLQVAGDLDDDLVASATVVSNTIKTTVFPWYPTADMYLAKVTLSNNRIENLDPVGESNIALKAGWRTDLDARRNKIRGGVTLSDAKVVLADNVMNAGWVTLASQKESMDARLSRNTIRSGLGVRVSARQGSVALAHNCIEGNVTGLEVLPTCPFEVNARYNWWGHKSGPYHQTMNPTGTGDRITGDNVDFSDWEESPTACRTEPPGDPSSLVVWADPAAVIPRDPDKYPVVQGKSKIYVETKDDKGQPAPGATVTFSRSPDLGLFLTTDGSSDTAECTTGVDGRCYVDYEAPKARKVHLEGSPKGVEIRAETGGSLPPETTEVEFVYLEVSHVRPPSGRRNVDYHDLEMWATFDRSIDPETVDDVAFRAETLWHDVLGCEAKAGEDPKEAYLDVVWLGDDHRVGLSIHTWLEPGPDGIRGEDGTMLRRRFEWQFYTTPYLDAVSVIPVQVSEDADLVAEREAVYRVHSGLSDDTELDWVEADVTLECTLPDGSESEQSIRGHRFYPGELGPGSGDPEAQRAFFQGNSKNFYSRDLGCVPKDGQLRLRASVKPSNQYLLPGQDPLENLNYSYPDARNVGLKIYNFGVEAWAVAPAWLFPDESYPWQIGDSIDKLENSPVVQQGPNLLYRLFPLRKGIDHGVCTRVRSVRRPDANMSSGPLWLARVARMNASACPGHVQAGVMVVPGEWLREMNDDDPIFHGSAHRICILADDAASPALAHCVGHLYGLRDRSSKAGAELRGYDLARGRYLNNDFSQEYNTPIMYSGIGPEFGAQGSGATSGDLSPPIWIDVQNYKHLVSRFTQPSAAARRTAAGPNAGDAIQIAVGGEVVQRSGQAETGLIDVVETPTHGGEFPPPAGDGDYALDFLNAGGTVLDSQSFAPEFGALEEGLEYASFLFTLSAPQGTRQVALRHGSKRLASVAASDNPPTVTFSQPVAGSYDGGIAVSWTGSDPDGDVLRYRVYYSQDDGTTWDTALFDTADTSFTLDTSLYASGEDCRVKVIASDGYYSAEDESETFSVRNAPRAIWVSPPDGAVDVPRYEVVRASFRDPMDSDTIDSASFALTDQWGDPIPGAVAYDPGLQQATFTPSGALPSRALLTARLDDTIQDALGQPLAASHTWTFRAETSGRAIYLPLVIR